MLDSPRRASALSNPGDRFRWGLLVLAAVGLCGLWLSVPRLAARLGELGTGVDITRSGNSYPYYPPLLETLAIALCSAAFVTPAVLWLPAFTPYLAGATAEVAALVALVVAPMVAAAPGFGPLFTGVAVSGFLVASGVGLLFDLPESPLSALLSKGLLGMLAPITVVSLPLGLVLGWRDPLLIPGWCLAAAALVVLCLDRFGWGASHALLAWSTGTVGFLLHYPAFAPPPGPIEGAIVRWSLTLLAAALALVALADLYSRLSPTAAKRVASRLGGLTARLRGRHLSER